MKKSVARKMEADGLYYPNRKILVSKELKPLWEMETIVHEMIHFFEDRYKEFVSKRKDGENEPEEVDKLAIRICRLIIKKEFKDKLK